MHPTSSMFACKRPDALAAIILARSASHSVLSNRVLHLLPATPSAMDATRSGCPYMGPRKPILPPIGATPFSRSRFALLRFCPPFALQTLGAAKDAPRDSPLRGTMSKLGATAPHVIVNSVSTLAQPAEPVKNFFRPSVGAFHPDRRKDAGEPWMLGDGYPTAVHLVAFDGSNVPSQVEKLNRYFCIPAMHQAHRSFCRVEERVRARACVSVDPAGIHRYINVLECCHVSGGSFM